jgi:radical SAM superfamily enzyme YgiQ (UPF0313 family)
MKVAIIYPPSTKGRRFPLLSQNRIFSYTQSNEIKIYPYVLAQAATLLNKKGHDVLYLDGINERLSEKEFLKILYDFEPQICILETKAPIICEHWNFINKLKKTKNYTFVLIGDHVSFFPKESLRKSEVDFVVRGGDYDFSLAGLIDYLEGSAKNLPGGIYYRDGTAIKNTGNFTLGQNLDDLPLIDRELTKWHIYGEAYLFRPCAYIMSGRGCGTPKGIGRCTFCIWQYALWKCSARLRSPQRVTEEIKELIENYRVKEIFDDNESGAIWNKEWLREFYECMKRENILGKVRLSSNARADTLDSETCSLLKKLNFRLLKIGLESGNNKTLNILKKDETVEQIIAGVKNAKDAGLRVMITVMVGYPWEDEEDIMRTYNIARQLLLYKTRCGDSLESNVVIPYPGTPLYERSIKNGYFKVDPFDYRHYGESKTLFKLDYDPQYRCNQLWQLHYQPKFIFKSLITARNLSDVKLLLRGLRSLIGHMRDWAGIWR